MYCLILISDLRIGGIEKGYFLPKFLDLYASIYGISYVKSILIS